MNMLHTPLRLNEENGDILDARGYCVAEGCTDNGQLRQIVDGVNRLDTDPDQIIAMAGSHWLDEQVKRHIRQLRAACEAKDLVIANCERMLRFAPPPRGVAETNEWQQAIQGAQNELKMGRPGQ